MSVKERLKTYLKSIKLSEKAFAEKIGVSSGYVSAMRQSIQPDKINNIVIQFPDLNTGWLLTGEGEMLRSTHNTDDQYLGSYVPLLPISAQGGSLSDFVVSVSMSDCEKVISPVKGVDFAITVAGDSMSPEYPSGSQILIKKINAKAFIEWGKVYVLDTCNGTIIKEIHEGGDESYVVCHSINPKFKPFKVAMEDIYGMYRVIISMSIK